MSSSSLPAVCTDDAKRRREAIPTPAPSVPAPGEDRGNRPCAWGWPLALYAIPVLVSLWSVTDPDIWWHLRTGQWIIDHGTVPASDPFSLPGLHKPWVAYSWLFEILVYGLYRWLGLAGVLVYRVALSLAVLHRLVARRDLRFLPAVGLTALGVLALYERAVVRSGPATDACFTRTGPLGRPCGGGLALAGEGQGGGVTRFRPTRRCRLPSPLGEGAVIHRTSRESRPEEYGYPC